MKDKFIDFLISKDVFDQWEANLGMDPDKFLLIHDSDEYIAGAFVWMNSPEKEKFWQELDLEWANIAGNN